MTFPFPHFSPTASNPNGINAFVGFLTAPNATGSSATTGVGFQPDILMMMQTSQTTGGSAIGGWLTFGGGISSSARACASTYGRGGVSPSETSHVTKNNYLMTATAGGGSDTASDKMDLVSLDSDGFTLTYPSNINGQQFPYMCLGGLSKAVGSFSLNTSTGAQAVTGVGFTPKAIILFTSTPNTTQTGQPTAYYSFGMGVSSSMRSNRALYNGDAKNPSESKSYYTDSHIYTEINNTVVVAQADLTSMDSDGFTLNVQTTDGTARTINYIALGGSIQTYVARAGSKTSTGNLAVTGVGFQPKALIFTGGFLQAAAIDTVSSAVIMGLGMGVSSTKRGAGCFATSDGSGTQGGAAVLDNTSAYTICGNIANVVLTADMVSMDSDGFTLNWTVAQAASYQYHYLAIR